MLDPKQIRSELDTVAEKLARRGFTLDVVKLTELENKRKEIQVRTQDLQSLRNNSSKSIGKAKANGDDVGPLLAAVADLGDTLRDEETALTEVQVQLDDILMSVPNLPHDSVPLGIDENDNEEVRRWGEPKAFGFEVKDHVDLGERG